MNHLCTLFLLFCLPLNASVEIYAAFDIGTGKIKMQVASVDTENGYMTTLFFKSIALSLDPRLLLGSDQRISEEAKEKILTSIKTLQEEAKNYKPCKSYAIATELFRKASNGQDVVRELGEASNIDIEIIVAHQEGIFGFMTASYEANLDPETLVVWDIGSGSFQISCKDENGYSVYCSPYGRHAIYELLKQNQIADFVQSLSHIPEIIRKKIVQNGGKVIGIGAHPKEILKNQLHYKLADLQVCQEACQEIGQSASTEMNMDYSDLILVQTVMRALSIDEVSYQSSIAGNTTALLLERRVLHSL